MNNFIKILKHNIIWIVLFLSAVLRLWNLNNIPPSLTPDEAALGYNAYSILKTGRDEYGSFMPLVFKSFGDYKPGLYVYVTVPFVALFGLNEFSVRIASALCGIAIVLLFYLITQKLFKSMEVIVAIVAAISPWLIQMSRGAWEVNLSLMLTLLGILMFLKGFLDKRYYYFSAVFFALSLIAYQGAKLSSLIVVTILTLVYKSRLKFKDLILPGVLGVIISLPILISILNGQVGRLSVFSVFSYKRPVEYIQAMLDQGNEKIGDINYLLFHNNYYDQLRGVMGRYFNHFSGRFLFIEGDFANPRHTPPYHGVLLLSDLIFLPVGIIYLLRSFTLNKISSDEKNTNYESINFILLWLLLSPLPSVLSRDQVHAVRSLNMAIPLIVIISIGISNIYNYLSKHLKSRNKYIYWFFSLSLLTVVTLSFVYYIDSYFIHLPKRDSNLWMYGYKQIVQEIVPLQKKYPKIVVQQSYAQPYIYFLFYGSSIDLQIYNPEKYQQIAKLNEGANGDVGQVDKINNIKFIPIDWSVGRGDHGSLYVADPITVPSQDSSNEAEFKLIKEIKYLNNIDTAFRIIEVK